MDGHRGERKKGRRGGSMLVGHGFVLVGFAKRDLASDRRRAAFNLHNRMSFRLVFNLIFDVVWSRSMYN